MKKVKLSGIILNIVTAVMLAISLFPLYYMILQSLTQWKRVDKSIIPQNITFESYKYLIETTNSGDPMMWIRAFLNSIIVCVPVAVVAIITSLLIGYATSKLPNFKGKKIILNLLFFEMFFPAVMLLVPKYMIMKNFANSFTGMVVPTMISVWAIFMYINYFNTLPDEIFEAAKMDGAGIIRIIRNIAIPATKPITVIVFLTIFMQRWNELMWDMLISPNINYQTLNVLISTRFNVMSNQPGPLYAASVILTLPIIILYLIFSKHFKEGINFMLK
jgi:multiple sugar transport system permease protein